MKKSKELTIEEIKNIDATIPKESKKVNIGSVVSKLKTTPKNKLRNKKP